MSTNEDFALPMEDFDANGFVAGMSGVLFADDFDPPPPPPAPAAAPPAPAPEITPTDLLAARAAGFSAGHAAAAAECAQAGAEAAQRACAALAAACAAAPDAARRASAEAAATVAHALLQALASVLPELCAEHGPREAACLAAALLPSLAHGNDGAPTRLTIAANTTTLAALRETIGPAATPLADQMRLETVDSMAPGDVALRWPEGAATRDTAQLLRALAEALAPLGIVVPQSAPPAAEPRPAPHKPASQPARTHATTRELVDV